MTDADLRRTRQEIARLRGVILDHEQTIRRRLHVVGELRARPNASQDTAQADRVLNKIGELARIVYVCKRKVHTLTTSITTLTESSSHATASPASEHSHEQHEPRRTA